MISLGIGAGWATLDCIRTQARLADRDFLGGARRLELNGRLSHLALCPQDVRDDSISNRVNYYASGTIRLRGLIGPAHAAIVHALQRAHVGVPRVRARDDHRWRGGGVARSPAARSSPRAAAHALVPRRVRPHDRVARRLLPAVQPLRARRHRAAAAEREPARVRRIDRARPIRSAARSLERQSGAPRAAQRHHVARHGERYALQPRARRGRGVQDGGRIDLRGAAAARGDARRLHDARRDGVRAAGRATLRGRAELRARLQPESARDPSCISWTSSRTAWWSIDGNPTQLFRADGMARACCSTRPRAETRSSSRAPSGGIGCRRSADGCSSPTFVDAGQVWNRPQQSFTFSDLRVTPGMGMRVRSPIGPLRVDVAYNGYQSTAGSAYFVGDDNVLRCVSPGNNFDSGDRRIRAVVRSDVHAEERATAC